MSTTAIILLCLHSFCFGGVVFGYFAESESAIGGALSFWFLLLIVTVTRFLVLL